MIESKSIEDKASKTQTIESNNEGVDDGVSVMVGIGNSMNMVVDVGIVRTLSSNNCIIVRFYS